MKNLEFLMGEVPEGVRGEVGEFLMGKRREFSKAVMEEAGRQEGTKFQKSVWAEIAKIPWGKTKTYQELAMAIGKPRAVRAVGTACGKNKYPPIVPCHRVLASGGGVGGYAFGVGVKRELLAREGVVV